MSISVVLLSFISAWNARTTPMNFENRIPKWNTYPQFNVFEELNVRVVFKTDLHWVEKSIGVAIVIDTNCL